MDARRSSTLPPGFYFDPTDEELVVYFLYHRSASLPRYPNIIPDLSDLYFPHPWELNDKAFMSRRQWYFFSRKMQNRAGEKGSWKDTGLDVPIFASTTGDKVGIKKFFVFHTKGVSGESQTNWIMEEFHLLMGENHIKDLEAWVLCRVHEANISNDGINFLKDDGDGDDLSYLDEVFLSMEDDGEEISFP